MPKKQASPRSGGQSPDIVCMMTIVLDNASGVYKAGDCIRGNVVFSLSKEVRVKGMYSTSFTWLPSQGNL